jgi:uncharacterized lipoprotein YddW (UPF0748 family)
VGDALDFKTKEDVLAVADRARARRHQHDPVPGARNATSFLRSSLEPWAEQYDYADPGFDPLETMIQAAHERHMQLKAWVNVVPAWYGLVPPASPRSRLQQAAEWMWYDQKGKRQQLSEKFYVSLNPCPARSAPLIVDVFARSRRALSDRRLASRLHPFSERAARHSREVRHRLPARREDARALQEGHGQDAGQGSRRVEPLAPDRVTELMRDIRTMMRATKPGLELSAAVGARFENALTHFQDAKEWLAQDLVDVVYPMNYTASLEEFQARSAVWLPLAAGGKVVMGMSAEKAAVDVNQAQLAHALRAFGGSSIFAYGSLFASPNRSRRLSRARGARPPR